MNGSFFSIPEAYTEKELEDMLREQRAREQAATIARILEANEKALAAPVWWTLENFRPVGVAKIGGTPCTMQDAIDALCSGQSGIIAGETNSGKSHLAVAVTRSNVDNYAMRLKDFELAILAEVNRFRPAKSYRETLDTAKKVGILVLDDLGKNACQVNGACTYYGNVVFSIMDARAESRLQTIITTRYTNGKAFEDRMGADLIRRFQQAEMDRLGHVSIVLGGAK